ncbi:hypothetical protein DAPPUDRAFT_306764 [Daphnia pulex]|uniref:Speedy protein A n=1 Tax=Daphnia pulex TaxID=6669 RepID=E9GYL2_DAPPU|nr:hypothetical protein DAPPUDRAFT_306764 [Daphnia pulex]|eukprot:EFX75415.1 hypothetical protein DAPPUDRAFT_306764 [Daphnia pulex]
MVIANVAVKREETGVSPYNKQYHAVSERNVGQNEFRLAVETVLPRLLGHSKPKRKQNFRDEENACPNTYVEAVYDFGRWLGSVSNSFHRYWTRKTKTAEVSVTASRMKDFFILLEDGRIKGFLEQDKCKIFADSYLLAMVFTYFLRAGFAHEEYNYTNFCAALFLAHDIEEENYLIDKLVVEWETKQIQNDEEYIPMHRLRYELFVRMDYRALVPRKVCEEIMAICPEHWAWKRKRHERHSGVYQDIRYPAQHPRNDSPWTSFPTFFRPCEPCLKLEQKSTAITAKKEARSAGNRLTLRKRQYSPHTDLKDCFMNF